MNFVYLLLVISIIPFAFIACMFFTIACTIAQYVNENHG